MLAQRPLHSAHKGLTIQMKVRLMKYAHAMLICITALDTPSNSPLPARTSFTMPGGLYDLSPTPEPNDRNNPRVELNALNNSPISRRAVSSTPEQPDLSVSRTVQSHRSWISNNSATPPPSITDSEGLTSSYDADILQHSHEGKYSRQSTIQIEGGKSPPSSYTLGTDHTSFSSPSRSSIIHPFGHRFSHPKSISVSSTPERSFEQERIKELEEEVQRLKTEVYLSFIQE
jgi:hypothetical protein